MTVFVALLLLGGVLIHRHLTNDLVTFHDVDKFEESDYV